MSSLLWLQKTNLIVAAILILGVNVVGASPKKYINPAMYKGEQHSVGADIVSVYLPTPDSKNAIPIPVQTFAASSVGFVDTGQRVSVYLRNGYKDDLIAYYPRATLIITAVAGAGHLLLGFFLRRRT